MINETEIFVTAEQKESSKTNEQIKRSDNESSEKPAANVTNGLKDASEEFRQEQEELAALQVVRQEQEELAAAQAAPPITGSKQWKEFYAAISQYAKSLKRK